MYLLKIFYYIIKFHIMQIRKHAAIFPSRVIVHISILRNISCIFAIFQKLQHLCKNMSLREIKYNVVKANHPTKERGFSL